ncbi:MAG: hypothetical protein AAFO94_21485 [Bacteroidota bacterium]
MMRKLLQITAAALLLITVACTKEGNNVEVSYSKDEVKGSWELTSVYSEDGKYVTTSSSNEVEADYEVSAKDLNWDLTFNEDDSFASEGDFTLVMETTTNGNTSEQTLEIPGWGRTGSWSVSGKILTVTVNSEVTTFEITELSDTKMKVMEAVDETSELPGTTIKTTVNVYYTFDKK